MSSLIESILNATIFRLFYYIERILCWIVGLLYQMFEVFAGLIKVKYNGTADYLINIFFSNKAVSNIYWGMALIGIALTFGFAIAAVIKKMFDASGKVQQSLGQIIFGGIRSIVVILGMTAIMSVVLNGTGVLMQQINYLFNDPYNLDLPVERTFTGEEYAAMGRILCTVGNYSKVESSDNRYNMNLCYNDIRSDMYYLQQQGIFRYSYYEKDQNGKVKESWQSVLAQIASSCDLSKDVKVDQYNDGVSRSLKKAMVYLQTTATPRPVPSVVRKSVQSNGEANLDRMIFLMGTFRAAKNPAFNENPSFDDALRSRYFYGEDKSIYNLDDVDSDFNIGFATDYIVVWIAAIAIIFDLVVIILNCIARIFNMLFLYLIAPPVIAAQPLDNGGKTKQWMTAFLVQSLSVFGTVIAMRLLLLFLPLISSPKLVLFEESAILNALAKLILMYGGFEAAKKSSSILTGILADSAGWQAVQAGDMSSSAGKVMGAAAGVGKAALGVAAFAAKPATNLVSRPFKSFAKHWSGLGTGKATTETGQMKEQIEKEHKMQEMRKAMYPEDNKSNDHKPTPPPTPANPGPGPSPGNGGPGNGPANLNNNPVQNQNQNLNQNQNNQNQNNQNLNQNQNNQNQNLNQNQNNQNQNLNQNQNNQHQNNQHQNLNQNQNNQNQNQNQNQNNQPANLNANGPQNPAHPVPARIPPVIPNQNRPGQAPQNLNQQ